MGNNYPIIQRIKIKNQAQSSSPIDRIVYKPKNDFSTYCPIKHKVKKLLHIFLEMKQKNSPFS
jgi:hypothetical protein